MKFAISQEQLEKVITILANSCGTNTTFVEMQNFIQQLQSLTRLPDNDWSGDKKPIKKRGRKPKEEVIQQSE